MSDESRYAGDRSSRSGLDERDEQWWPLRRSSLIALADPTQHVSPVCFMSSSTDETVERVRSKQR